MGCALTTFTHETLIKHFGEAAVIEESEKYMRARDMGLLCIMSHVQGSEPTSFPQEVMLLRTKQTLTELTETYDQIVAPWDKHEGCKLHSRVDFANEKGQFVYWAVGNQTFDRKQLERILKEEYAK